MSKLIFTLLFIVSLNAITVEQLFNIKTIKVIKKSVRESRTYNGYAKIADSKIYTVTVTEDGFIKNLTAPNIYDRVTKSKKLFDIYTPKVYKAQIELLSALKVDKNLAKAIEKKLTLLDVSKKDIKSIKKYRKVYKYLPFYSPYSGVVIDKKVTEGSAVKKGMSIYKIADLSTIWVEAKAYEVDRDFIKNGDIVEVTFSGDKEIYNAKIDYIYPLVDLKNRAIEFRVVINNRNMKIKPNSYATIKVLKERRDILMLPSSAVVTKGEKHIVFVPSEYEGEYISREIEAKRVSQSQFEILSGLKESDEVVNNSLFLIDSDILINGNPE